MEGKIGIFNKKIEVTPKILGIVIYKTIGNRYKEVAKDEQLESLQFNEPMLIVDSFILNFSIIKHILLKKYDYALVKRIINNLLDYFCQDLDDFYNQSELDKIKLYCNENIDKYEKNVKTIFEFHNETGTFNNPIRDLSKMFLKEICD